MPWRSALTPGSFTSPGKTPTQIAVQPCLNGKKVPQLFVFTGSNCVINPNKYPYTMAGGSSYGLETIDWAAALVAHGLRSYDRRTGQIDQFR